MFDFSSWSQWTWVWIAWGQLILAYLGYSAYLNWRRGELLRHDAVQRAIEAEQRR